jgi:hypothetical protein
MMILISYSSHAPPSSLSPSKTDGCYRQRSRQVLPMSNQDTMTPALDSGLPMDAPGSSEHKQGAAIRAFFWGRNKLGIAAVAALRLSRGRGGGGAGGTPGCGHCAGRAPHARLHAIWRVQPIQDSMSASGITGQSERRRWPLGDPVGNA